MDHQIYHQLLQFKWLQNHKTEAEPWMLENYRDWSLEELFQHLEAMNIFLDRISFLALADEKETPEDLTDAILAESRIPTNIQGLVYLIVFELWRRLSSEKLSLSLFCEELDYQIDQYERQLLEDLEPIQDIIANLTVILDESSDDESEDPHEVFASICEGCAHDVEGFLYNYIADQIDEKEISYATELFEDFSPYISDTKWFSLLHAQLAAVSNFSLVNSLVDCCLKKIAKEPDLEFQLELISFLARIRDRKLFIPLIKKTIPLLKHEEEFQDLLMMCEEYLRDFNLEQEGVAVRSILNQRAKTPLNQTIHPKDQHATELLHLLDASHS